MTSGSPEIQLVQDRNIFTPQPNHIQLSDITIIVKGVLMNDETKRS